MKNYFITNSKSKAQKKLKDLFNTKIISAVELEPKGYRIEWIEPKEFYKDAVEQQGSMDKYLEYLLQQLEPVSERKETKTDKQIEEEEKAKIYEELGGKKEKKIKKKKEYWRSLDNLYSTDESMKVVEELWE